MQSACPGGYNLVQRQASVFQIVVVVFQSGNRGILYNYYTKTTCDGSSRQKKGSLVRWNMLYEATLRMYNP